MRIAVDIDGVLLDIMLIYCEKFNQKYNKNYRKKDVTDWEFFRLWNITEQEAYDIFFSIYEDSMKVPFIDERAPEIMKELNKIHEVNIVSARQAKYRKPILKKLEFHNIRRGQEYENLILLRPKPYDIKLQLNFDVYIDDNPNLAKAIQKLSNRMLLLYDQPWNKKIKESRNVKRVFNWNDIYQYIINF